MGGTLIIPGRYDKIQQACQFVAAGAAQAGLDDTAVFHVELACDEACTNVIEHAYAAEDVGDIYISWEVQAGRFMITIHDHGRAFDPATVPVPPTTEAEMMNDGADDFPRVGGLGVHFMRKLMDEVQYHFSEQGNTLTLVKMIN
ncbi:MAG TPA: ATP-binding protein [Chloroflexota bacterium]|nr:ATP-binding protein [Chloroflexota bacterium]HUM70916.1 ATP-binding protein [Chloroflexota bacterium]